MPHIITGIIAKSEQFNRALIESHGLRFYTLNHGFEIISFGEDEKFRIGKIMKIDDLIKLTVTGKCALVETEYFAGEGMQAATVYDCGVITNNRSAAESGVINRALIILGITRGDSYDEFESIGLHKYRSFPADI